MRKNYLYIFAFMALNFLFVSNTLAADTDSSTKQKLKTVQVQWQEGGDVESFWKAYTDSKGGLTWAQSKDYPDYDKVKEGDTFLVELERGVCLMEFFHSRWRRANDVRRWSESMNEYSACPKVFD